jgi:Carbamoyl-phosphate synthase L chain, ATP binding domain
VKLEPALRLDHAASPPRPPPVVSFFEFWPGWLFYAPIVAQWVALGLRYGDFALPTAANPTIETGGLCGESKRSILDQVGGAARDTLARYSSIVTHASDATADTEAAEAAMVQAGLAYPVVVKPDIGCNGTGVRLVQDQAALARYLAVFPRNAGVLLQEFIPEDGEAGLFYIREPGQGRGSISSITLKFPPTVTGDGRSTLQDLVMADPRAGRVAQLYLPRLRDRLQEVPRQGEQVRLVFVGNHCKGSIFRNGTALATEALTDRVERLAHALPNFHFGRIDVRFGSVQALARGEGFRVIEINGVGSEATHVWDPATSLTEAWRAQFHHYGAAFRIAAANRAQGHNPTRLRALWRHWRKQKRLMAAYPMND